jgi:uncharacterized coiled-coil protein SlyX
MATQPGGLERRAIERQDEKQLQQIERDLKQLMQMVQQLSVQGQHPPQPVPGGQQQEIQQVKQQVAALQQQVQQIHQQIAALTQKLDQCAARLEAGQQPGQFQGAHPPQQQPTQQQPSWGGWQQGGSGERRW